MTFAFIFNDKYIQINKHRSEADSRPRKSGVSATFLEHILWKALHI